MTDADDYTAFLVAEERARDERLVAAVLERAADRANLAMAPFLPNIPLKHDDDCAHFHIDCAVRAAILRGDL